MAQPGRWICKPGQWDRRAERTILRFPINPAKRPQLLILRLGQFDRVAIAERRSDGTVSPPYSLTMRDARPFNAGLRQILPLRHIDADTRELVVALDGVWTVGTLSEARLARDANAAAWPERVMMLLAAICGLLLGPLIFNMALWRVLRARFLIWHFFVVLGMLGQTLVTTGLIVRVIPLTITQMVWMPTMTVAVSIAAACMFGATFLEKGVLSRRTILGLRSAAAVVLIVSTVYACHFPSMRLIGADIYYASFIPVVVVLCWAMWQALRRGSRAVWFQIAAWSPVIVMGLIRIATNLGVGDKPDEVMVPFMLAIALEVLITALGVADRFIDIRLERDRAKRRAGELEYAADRDPLTGLFNRRGVEARFETLRRAGFDTFALLDLDHFKSVNDILGHATGDRVLIMASESFLADPDIVALRLGGEEFMLALRGRDGVQRAEARRQAIPGRVATAVQGLPWPVTASMGLVELPTKGLYAISFKDAYERADRLLYEAKRAGRNRTMRVRMHEFGEPSARKPAKSAAKGRA